MVPGRITAIGLINCFIGLKLQGVVYMNKKRNLSSLNNFHPLSILNAGEIENNMLFNF